MIFSKSQEMVSFVKIIGESSRIILLLLTQLKNLLKLSQPKGLLSVNPDAGIRIWIFRWFQRLILDKIINEDVNVNDN